MGPIGGRGGRARQDRVGRPPKLWYLKLNRLFRSLSDDDLRRWVDRIAVAMDYPRHSLIYMADEPGEHVYVLKVGRVRLYHVGEDGHEVTLSILDSGDVFGEEVLAREPRRTFAQALEPAHVCRLRGEDFVELMRQHPDVAIEALALIARHSMSAQAQVERLAGHSVAQRIAGLLADLAASESAGGSGPVALAPGLTHETMASMLGTARQTFTSELTRLVELGYVAREGRRLRIPDVGRLRAFATSGMPEPSAARSARPERL